MERFVLFAKLAAYMKLSILILLLFANSLSAQLVLSPMLQVKALKKTKIELEMKKRPEKQTAFGSFLIKDLRTDTVTAGYVKFSQKFSKYFRLEMENGVKSVSLFLNRYFYPEEGAEGRRLHILLKNFFLTQDYKMPSTGVNLVNDVYTSKAFLSAHLVVQEGDKYYLVGSADTVLTRNKWLGKSYNAMAENTFIYMVEKASQLIVDGKKEEIDFAAFAERSVIKPLAVDHPAEGFYLTYNAFRKDEPKPVAVQFEQKKKGRVMRPATASDSAIVQSAWGFVESGVLYVRYQHVYIPMQASFGSWSGLGIGTIEVVKMPSVINPLAFVYDMADIAISGPVAKAELLKLYKLNEETGLLE